MAVTELEAKVTIAKVVQLAYDTNGDKAANIIFSRDGYSISVDQSGEVKMVGTIGNTIIFNGESALEGLGFKVKRVSVNFTNGDGGTVNFSGSFDFVAGTSISVAGSFDVYSMIKSCSGLLCKAARFLDGRDAQIEQELQQYIR